MLDTDPTSLSLLFHLNSEPWLNAEAYRAGAPGPVAPIGPPVLGAVDLPAPTPDALGAQPARRPSCRSYRPTTISLDRFSDVLAAAYGAVGGPLDGDRRVVPSAGGLYPLELIIVLRRIDGLADGVYRYEPRGHGLDRWSEGDRFDAMLATGVYAHPFIEDANAFVALTAPFERTQRKYGPRGYRYLLLEAGHVAQNLCLAAGRRGLATLCIGGFVDSILNAELGLDPRVAGVLYGVGVGVAAEDGGDGDGDGDGDG